MKCNYHTHTTRCKHAFGEDEAFVQAAITAGFDVLGFADHAPWPYRSNFVSHMRMSMDQLPDYVASIRSLREKYAGQIQLHIGLECEYFPSYADNLRRLLDSGVEYLILGAHFNDTDETNPYVAPHHDIYSIEDLRQLVYSLKEASEYKKPVIVKVAAVHNIAAIASGIARSGADIIAIDGFRGGTGAAPTRIRDNVGIPVELALAAVDQRLRDEGIRNNVSLVVGGSIRSSSDIVKAIALGADACYIATAALLALGCHLCRTCQSGKCNWGIATQRPELVKRLNPDVGSERLINLMTAWKHEIKELMGGMGINSIEALRGNRLMLRGVGLNEKELEILGISHAGE